MSVNKATDKILGTLEVGHNERGEVVINHPDLDTDEHGVGHIVFSPSQARDLAKVLVKQAGEAECEMWDLRTVIPKQELDTCADKWKEQFDKGPLREALSTFDPALVAPASPVLSVDRSARTLTDGSPVPADESHRTIGTDGQQRAYVVLSEEERRKGFVRPIRRSYVHIGKPGDGERFEYPIRKTFKGGCGTRTTMGLAIAETYARDPGFYAGTFCCSCERHVPLDECVWEGTVEVVGS